MPEERNGSKEEGFQLQGCSSEPGLDAESVTEMKNKKTVKLVKPIDREVNNITRKVLRSGSVAIDTDKHDVAVGEKGDDLSEVDEVKEGKALLSVANDSEHDVAVEEERQGDVSEVDKISCEVKEEAKRELVESPVPKETHGKEAQVKRKRGRPRKLQISSQSDGNEENTKVSLGADSTSLAEELKVKRKRGRPRKFPITGQSDTTTPDTVDSIDDSSRPKRNCGSRAKGPESDGRGRKMGRPKTKKKPGETDELDCKATMRLRPCESSLKSRHNNKPSSDGEVRNGEEQNDDGRRSKLESKKKLSDRILQLLLAAGWTVEYRPRKERAYNAAVYVNPEGKTHWSVTKAYEVYKTNLERNMTDQVDSGLGLLPEEDLHLLRRKVHKKRSDTGKPRKDTDTTNEDTVVSRKGVGEKAQKKRKVSHKFVRSSVSVRKIKREEKHNRKRGALSARSSLSDADSNENGYILFEGKRTMLGWMIDSAILPLNGKVECKNTQGIITKEGIRCNCCAELFSVVDFEVHSGGKPFKSLYVEGGNSILQCFLESWNKQSDAVLKGFHVVDFGSGDQNDDTCAICGDGGDLTCCDGCPSTFHQTCLGIKKFPAGSWFCCNCSCKFCEKVEAANHGTTTTLSPLLRCHLCEEKYHQACIKQDGTVPVESSTLPFCGKYCQELFDGLQLLIGVKHSLPEGFSWTFLRRFEMPREVSNSDISEKVAYNAKLAVAFSVMDECFSPLVDHRSGVNLLENIVYNFGSNFHRLNYSNFLTAVLERGDEIIGVASIRIHGNQLAEMPFIGTRYMYRRQGMCRRLMNGIESALSSLKVDKLIIPAVPELMDTWTSGFGFTPVSESARKTIKNLNLVVFPGVDMLEKSLAKDNGELLLAAEMSLPVDVEETKPEECKDELDCGTADAESPSYQVDSCLKSMDVVKGVNDTDLNLKSLEEKEEIGTGKLTDKEVDLPHVVVVDNQRESNLGVTHEDQTDRKRQQSGDLKSSGVKAEGTEEPDEESDCYIIENSQPLGNGGTEGNFGGFPVWLKYVPGISFRTDNEPFKRAMQGFTERIVQLMKSENLYESQGGPIILSQIENEYGRQGQLLGAEGHNYMTWAAKMAIATETGVPWVMCKEDDAPDPVINTCNGFYCDSFAPNKPYKPLIWTEAWSGWFTEFGGPMHHRPVQDLAFAVARFIQKGGSFVNYYMYHGGTNFGRTAGGPFVTTSYDYDAPIDEYGLIREPKYGHLKELHRAIKMCEKALVSTDPVVTSLGNKQQAHVYSSESGECSAFLANYDTESAARVLFNNVHYNLPPWSISILPDCRNAVFNTAKVGVQTSQMEMLPTSTPNFQWQSYLEDLSSLDDSSTFTTQGLLEQINVTRDTSDYLWYMTSVDIGSTESFLHGGELPTLIIQSTGHAVHIFVNGQLSGSAFGTRQNRRFTYRGKINLHSGANRIALLSVAVGLPNVGGHFESWNTGILGPVALHGLSQGKRDLSWQKWTYQVGLKGEAMNLAYPTNTPSNGWMDASLVAQKSQPLTWHKAYFDAPEGNEPLALDMEGMGKGQVWVNGESIGRYWTAFATGDCGHCSYTGTYKPNKCLSGCGQPTQRYYHVPRSWLKPSQNLLVIFEELGGNPSAVSLVKRSVSGVCAEVSEYHPNIKNWQIESYGKGQTFRRPKVHLKCSHGQAISAIKFASFGTPLGKCGSYQQGECHAATSYSILERKCVGKATCAVTISNSNFGKDPCPNVLKRLTVEAVCSPETSITSWKP